MIVFFADGSMRQVDRRHYDSHVLLMEVDPRIFYPVPESVRGPVSAERRFIDKGMRDLEGDRPPRADHKTGIRAAMPRARGGTGGGGTDGSGTDVGSSGESDVPSLVVEPSESESDAAVEPGVPVVPPRERAPVWEYQHGQLLINRTGNSIDARCNACGAGADRTWKERPRARQGHTIAQGRMLGSHFAWLALECYGDAEYHLAQYTDEGLPRHVRKLRRLDALTSGDYTEPFAKERDPKGDESDGEPLHIPVNVRHT